MCIGKAAFSLFVAGSMVVISMPLDVANTSGPNISISVRVSHTNGIIRIMASDLAELTASSASNNERIM